MRNPNIKKSKGHSLVTNVCRARRKGADATCASPAGTGKLRRRPSRRAAGLPDGLPAGRPPRRPRRVSSRLHNTEKTSPRSKACKRTGSEHGPPPRGGASSPTPQTCAAAQAARDSDVTLKRGSFGSYSHTSSKPILQKHLNVRMPLLPLFKQ